MTDPASVGQTPGVAVQRDSPGAALASPLELHEVYDAHAGYVWNTLRRLGAHDTDLEDLTQDVFLHVQRHLSDYDPERPMKPWLFGFAIRVVSQYKRQGRRRKEDSGSSIDPVDPAPLADEHVAAGQDRRLVLSALDALDTDRRAVFVLYEIDGVRIEDIAQSMGIPVNTAYSRLRVARGEFRAAVTRIRRSQR